jgi:hypothetical protein
MRESRLIHRVNDLHWRHSIAPSAPGEYSRWRLIRHAVTAITCVFFCCTILLAQQPRPNEYQVKAAYLYNFAKFVKWPVATAPDKNGSFSICVLGPDPFGGTLDSTLAGESLDNKPVVVKRISKPQGTADCRILFINSAEQGHLKEILAALDQESILTVSDMPDFSERGGMIQFVLEGGKVRFEVNLSSAEKARLTLSSELLKVATTVKRNTSPGD